METRLSLNKRPKRVLSLIYIRPIMKKMFWLKNYICLVFIGKLAKRKQVLLVKIVKYKQPFSRVQNNSVICFVCNGIICVILFYWEWYTSPKHIKYILILWNVTKGPYILRLKLNVGYVDYLNKDHVESILGRRFTDNKN